MLIKLRKPLVLGEGDDKKTIDEVKIDVDAITGADIMFCVSEAAAAKGVVVHYQIDQEVHLQMAAKLTGLPRAALMRMDGRDFNRVLAPVADFFLNSD